MYVLLMFLLLTFLLVESIISLIVYRSQIQQMSRGTSPHIFLLSRINSMNYINLEGRLRTEFLTLSLSHYFSQRKKKEKLILYYYCIVVSSSFTIPYKTNGKYYSPQDQKLFWIETFHYIHPSLIFQASNDTDNLASR